MRVIDLARERGYNFQKLFSFELVDTNFYMDKKGLIIKPTVSIMTELERKHAESITNIRLQDNNDCCCIVNIMYKIKKVATARLKTFGDLVTSFLNSIISNIPTKTTRIDFIFESLLQSSPKVFEKVALASEGTIRLSKVEQDTPLPAKMAMFWASIQNEMKFQKFVKSYILNAYKFATQLHIFCSAMIYEEEQNQCESVQSHNGKVICHPALRYSHLEQGQCMVDSIEIFLI